MKSIIVLIVILSTILVACAPAPAPAEGGPTPNLKSTVDAAVAATVSVLAPGEAASPTPAKNEATPTTEVISSVSGFDDLAKSAERVTYDELFRNNESHVKKHVYFRGQVAQVLPVTGDEYQLRINVTEGTFFWTDTVFVHYTGPRLLDDDIVEFVAEVRGLATYTAVLGNSITLPELDSLDLRLIHDDSALVTHTPVAEATDTPAAASATPSPGFSRTSPLPIGSPVRYTDDEFVLDVSVVEIVRGDQAWSMISAAWSYNDPPEPGFEYLLV